MNALLRFRKWIQLLLIGACLVGVLSLTTIASAQGNCGTTETVVKGDTLRIIAARCGVTLADLEKANPQIVNFNLIFPGQIIYIPQTASPTLSISPLSGPAGTKITVTGSGFPANTTLGVNAGPLNGETAIAMNVKTDSSGKLSVTITIPAATKVISAWVITAATQTSGGLSASARFQMTALPPSGTYTIVAGDTLYGIAIHFNTTISAMLRANPQITNPNRIETGDQLYIPGTLVVINGQKVYFVKQGDYMGLIAANQGVTLAALIKANPQITNPSLIFAGQRVIIP